MVELSEVEAELIVRRGWRILRNSGIAAVAFGGAHVATGWEVLLFLACLSATFALTGGLTLIGVFGRARTPLIGGVLFLSSAFLLVDAGVWRWVFVGFGVFLALATFSRKTPPY